MGEVIDDYYRYSGNIKNKSKNGKFSSPTNGNYKKMENRFNNFDVNGEKIGTFTEERPRISEQKIAGILFTIIISIMIGKLFVALKAALQSKLNLRELLKSYWTDPITGQTYMTFHWETVTLSSKVTFLIWPIICGLTVTIFSWIIVYFDSKIPGVNPPTPFTSNYKYKSYNITQWDVNYLMAVLNGIMVFLLILASYW